MRLATMGAVPYKMGGSRGRAWQVILIRGPIIAPSRPADCRKPSVVILRVERGAQTLVTVAVSDRGGLTRGGGSLTGPGGSFRGSWSQGVALLRLP